MPSFRYDGDDGGRDYCDAYPYPAEVLGVMPLACAHLAAELVDIVSEILEVPHRSAGVGTAAAGAFILTDGGDDGDVEVRRSRPAHRPYLNMK